VDESGLLRRRVAVGAALVCALLVLAPVPSLATQSTVVPRDGLYRGKSVQGSPVKFRLRKGVITGDILFTVKGSGGCSLTVHYTFSKAKVKGNGTFKLVSGGMTVTGKYVTATSVRGTLSAPSCTSAPRSVAYSARRVG